MNDAPIDSARPHQNSTTGPVPRSTQAVLRGSLGFAVASLVAFSVWAFAGHLLQRRLGEVGLYLVIAGVFIGLSGLLLHPLVRGEGSRARFYKAFVPAFGAYAVVWCGAWFGLGAGWGEWLGSLMGCLVFALLVAREFRCKSALLRAVVVLFALHSAGYFLGGQLMAWLLNPATLAQLGNPPPGQMAVVAKLGWGLLYGVGFGAGIGYVFFTMQQASSAPKPASQGPENASRGSG